MESQPLPVPPRPLPEPNPATRRAYRRQSFWQITLPFLLALLLILALAGGTIWAAAGGLNEVTRWMDISVIWLLSPQLFFSLLNLVLLGVLVFGLAKLLHALPRYFRLLHDKFLVVQQIVKTYSDKAVEPVYKLRGIKASADALKYQITHLLKG